jgi:hypothetical protein
LICHSERGEESRIPGPIRFAQGDNIGATNDGLRAVSFAL